MTQTILVTGGAGYIGSHTCKFLHERGYTPVVLDNLVYGHRSAVKWGPFIEGDIHDREGVDRIFSEYSPAAVIHFAAFAYVGESMLAPGKYYQNNVAGTLSLLESMRRNGCPHIVFSSSCATYGLPETLPLSESHPRKPISPYGRSKLMVEEILRDYDSAHGLKSVSLRYFNAAGADLAGELGEDHAPETHLIPLAVAAALGTRPELQIFGTDYPTADGTAVRDFVHVTDLAAAHVQALEFLARRETSQAINLGTGRGYSVREIVREVERVSGREVPVVRKERRAGDPPVLVADAARAGQLLGWKPTHSDLPTIISSAWKWHAGRRPG